MYAFYKVNYGQETPDEPHAGWYYAFDNEEGEREIKGPFASRAEAVEAIDRKRNPVSHDYPACAIFRGGKCSCDVDDVPNGFELRGEPRSGESSD